MDIFLAQITSIFSPELILLFFATWKIIWPAHIKTFQFLSRHLGAWDKKTAISSFELSIEVATSLRDNIFIPFRKKIDPVLFQEYTPDIHSLIGELGIYLGNNCHITYNLPELFQLQLNALIEAEKKGYSFSIYSKKPRKNKDLIAFRNELYRDFSYTYYSLNNHVKSTLSIPTEGLRLYQYRRSYHKNIILAYPVLNQASKLLFLYLIPLVFASILSLTVFVVVWGMLSNILPPNGSY